jgi:LCP family protein required for cell wall assembly
VNEAAAVHAREPNGAEAAGAGNDGDAGGSDAGGDGGPAGTWDEPLPDAGVWSGKTEWVLMLGFDDWSRLPGRTDAIILAAFRHETGDVGLVSVPRDLWVDIPGWEPGRINKVYRVGEMLHGRGGGNRLMTAVIRQEFGIRIDHTVTADFRGFRQVVDLLGGIHVEVACPIRDNFIDPASPTGYDRLDLRAGRQRLDGHAALLYSRSRHGRTDLDRARRQQAVMVGLKHRLTAWNVVPRLPWLWRTTKAHTRTDLDLAGAVRLATTLVSAGAGMVHGLVLKPPVVRSWRSPEGQSVLVLDRRASARALAGLFDAPAPGVRDGSPCPDPDVAVNWRDRAREYRLKKGDPPTSPEEDGGPETEDGFAACPEDEPSGSPSP